MVTGQPRLPIIKNMRVLIAGAMVSLTLLACIGCHAEKVKVSQSVQTLEPASAPADYVPLLVYLELMENGGFDAFRRFPWNQWLNPYWKSIATTDEANTKPEELIAIYLWNASPSIRDAEVLPNASEPSYLRSEDIQASILEEQEALMAQAGVYPEYMPLSADSGSLLGTPLGQPNPFSVPQTSTPQTAGTSPAFGAPFGMPQSPSGGSSVGAPSGGPGLDFTQPGSVY